MEEVLENYSQEIYVSRIHRHPDFVTGDSGYTKGSDLALLEMAYEPMTDNYTRPVCLGNANSYKDIIDKGKKAECYITGFGMQETEFFQVQYNRHLKASKVHVVDPQLCNNLMYYQLDASYVANDAMCLENREPYAPSNRGDSGGPMVCKDEHGRFKLFGVTSWGMSGADKNAPTIYVNIIYYQEWIESITGIPLT
ncbi:transmembrane protease serine 9-like [Dreissena polymorpha]|nr:transmembrane protease serine 9-like [Dreissena polymorpha]